eukprot:g16888.t1
MGSLLLCRHLVPRGTQRYSRKTYYIVFTGDPYKVDEDVDELTSVMYSKDVQLRRRAWDKYIDIFKPRRSKEFKKRLLELDEE